MKDVDQLPSEIKAGAKGAQSQEGLSQGGPRQREQHNSPQANLSRLRAASTDLDVQGTSLAHIARLSPAVSRASSRVPALDRHLHALPRRQARKDRPWALITFVLCVIIPSLLAAAYYGLIASRMYVSEFRFTVKEASSVMPSSTSGSPMGVLPHAAGLMNDPLNNYIVTDYLTSRPAVEELENRIGVIARYSNDEIDWWSRFDSRKPIEKFVRYWNEYISTRFDILTGISTAKVRAFSAQDAFLIANTLMVMSEELVNELSTRAQNDALQSAQREAENVAKRLQDVTAKLADFRNRSGVVDPSTSVVASNSALIQQLRSTLAQLETQAATLTKQNLQPDAPVLASIRNQIRSTKEQLQNVEAGVGREGETGAPLSVLMKEYEQLDLERQFAQTLLTGALKSVEEARTRAAQQRLYITPYVKPALPESATYPEVLYSVIQFAGIAFGLWIIGLLLARSVRERFA